MKQTQKNEPTNVFYVIEMKMSNVERAVHELIHLLLHGKILSNIAKQFSVCLLHAFTAFLRDNGV